MRYYLSTKDACFAPNAKNADPISLRWPHNVVCEGGKQHDNGNLENDAIAIQASRTRDNFHNVTTCSACVRCLWSKGSSSGNTLAMRALSTAC